MIQYPHKESRNSSRCETPSRHTESSHVHMPRRPNTCRNDPSHKRPSAYNDFEHYRSSHRSPSPGPTRGGCSRCAAPGPMRV